MRNDLPLASPVSATFHVHRGTRALRVPFRSLAAVRSIFTGKRVLELSLVFATYLLAGRIGLVVPFTSGNVSPVWPAAGVAMAALLLVGYRVWPAIAAAAFLVNLFTPISGLAAIGIAVGNTVGPFTGAWLTRRISGFTPSLTRLKDVLGIIAIAAPVGAAISAFVGVTVLFGTGATPWVTFGRAAAVWWLGDSMGVLVVTPVVLTFLDRPVHGGRQIAELGALLTTVAVACLIMFHPSVSVQSGTALAAAVIPFVLWGAIRFETQGASAVVLVVSSVVLVETGLGRGPFSGHTAAHNAALLQAFLAMITVSGLTLAAVVAEKSYLIREQARRDGVAEGERQYHRIIETANEGIWILDDRLVTIFANQRLAALLGDAGATMVGRSLFDFVFEEDAAEKATVLTQPRQGVNERIQQRYRRSDGSELWALVSRTPMFDEDGAFTGVLKMVSDITEDKRAEQERQRARETILLLSKAVDQTADSVIVTDSGGRIEYVNPAFERTTGYTREDALGNTPRLLKSGQHDEAFYKEMWDVLLGGQPFHGTLVNARKNGEHYWAEQTITPMKDAGERITHFVSVLKDVTVARRDQEQQTRLLLAREVQQRFYTATVRVPGFDIAACAHPAEQTGGDYFDVIESADGRCYLAIGDVSGHGLDAALIMAMTRAYVRSFAALGLGVGETLARVNQALVADLQEDRYVTMLLARLDPHCRTLEYASAGHPVGVLLGRGGDTQAVLDSTGMPLGLFRDLVCQTRTILLDGGQTLVLFTDGAIETSTADHEEFGCERLLNEVRAHLDDDAKEIAEAIYQAGRTFAAGARQHDDVTCVIVKVSEAVEAPLSLQARTLADPEG